MINSIMDSVNVIDMNFDLNECPIDDMSHDSGYSQTIVEHSDHAIVEIIKVEKRYQITCLLVDYAKVKDIT
jgi:hypothetical protein